MRTLQLDGSGNRNQDRSIQPGAIVGELPPGALAPPGVSGPAPPVAPLAPTPTTPVTPVTPAAPAPPGAAPTPPPTSTGPVLRGTADGFGATAAIGLVAMLATLVALGRRRATR
jgi:hypothetical protein